MYLRLIFSEKSKAMDCQLYNIIKGVLEHPFNNVKDKYRRTLLQQFKTLEEESEKAADVFLKTRRHF